MRATSNVKTEAFTKCIEPLMNDFIQREIIERFSQERKEPLFLAYGNFPGKEQFSNLLYNALSIELGALSLPNVGSCNVIENYLVHNVKASPKNYHDKIIWFRIKDMDPKQTYLDPELFSALNKANFHTWYALESLNDPTIGVVITYECASTALFGLNCYWDKFFESDRLWRVFKSPLDYAAMIADDIRNRIENIEMKPVKKYYQRFQKEVLAFARSELKKRQKRSREHQWGVTYEKQNPYPYNQTVPGNSIDAFLKLVGDVNKKYGIDIEMDPSSAQYQQKYGNSGDVSNLTYLIQKAAKQQNIYQEATLAEARSNNDPDYWKYISMHRLQSELNEAFHDMGGEDFDGDDGTMIVHI